MDLPFILKKIISHILYPSSLVFIFLLSALLTSFSRYRRSQTRFFLILASLTFYFSSTFFPSWALKPLEDCYPLPPKDALKESKAIVLLPCFIDSKPGLNLLERIGGETSKRFLAALLLKKEFPQKPLFIIGAGNRGGLGASYLQELAEKLGFKDVFALDEAHDTITSAKVAKKYLAGKSFILVTAAYHLPRAVFLFRKEGLSPIPYPAYRLVKPHKDFTLRDLWPRPLNLFYLDLAVHEYLGLAFYHLIDHIPF